MFLFYKFYILTFQFHPDIFHCYNHCKFGFLSKIMLQKLLDLRLPLSTCQKHKSDTLICLYLVDIDPDGIRDR